MGKSIKKLYKILIILLLIIVGLPTSAFFILKSSRVQTFITQKIIKEVSKNLHAKFEVESVNFKFFNRIVLKNVYIEDQQKDTLLFSKELICNIRNINRKQGLIDISNVNLINSKFYLNKYDSLKAINLKFFTDILKRKESSDTSGSRWKIQFQNIEMHQMVFRYNSYRKVDRESGVNFNDLECDIDDLDIRNFTIQNGVVNFYTKKLKFTEKSGFKVHSMKFNMSIAKEFMEFRNVKIRTPYSFVDADSLIFKHTDFDKYSEFAKNIYLDFGLQESNVSFKDIGYFATIFKNIQLNAVISGRFYSKLSTFKGKDVKIHVGEQTELITDFNLNGLPDHKQMFMYVDFKKLTTWAKDFELINKFLKSGKKITIPESFNKLGIINYKGNFAGFYDDFVTYGKFTSNLGTVSTDLSLKPDTNKTLAFNGKIKTVNFNVGELIPGTQRIGKISMNAQINGSTGKNKTVQAKTDGVIQNIEINNYNYQNIILDGYLTEKTYNGYFNISDPNIDIDFSGGIDFSKTIPVFNFTAKVPKANLYGLNIDKKDTTANLSFNVNANFEGNSIDNAIGKISFYNSKLTKFDEEMSFDSLKIISEQIADTHRIELNSDYVDLLLLGTYKSTTLIQSVKNLYYNYLPGLIGSSIDTLSLPTNNNFSLDLTLKKTNIISRFFFPTIYFSDNSTFNLKYNSEKKQFLLNAYTDELRFRKQTFRKLTVNTYSNDSIFSVMTKCNSFLLNNYFNLENFKTTSITSLNNIDLKIDWNNDDVINSQGKILASTFIKQKEPFDDPSISITLLPSQVVVKDYLWNIGKSIIKIDTTSYSINNFFINHGTQFFEVNGKISEDPNDTLFIESGDLNLSNINILSQNKKLVFEGIINGKANVSGLYNNPLFYAKFEINDLKLNNEEFGYTEIYSKWNESQKAIKLDAHTYNKDKRTINISGNYYPAEKNINFDIYLDRLGLHVLNPYLSSFASNIQGNAIGGVKVTGSFSNPEFNGSLFLQNSAMTIDYINTRYDFETEAQIKKNTIIFKNVDVYDMYNNKAITNGNVKFGPKKSITFDFIIKTNKILSLNTNQAQNEAFFGTAFTSGIVNVNGNNGNTSLDISAKTEANTKISIPLTRAQSAGESSFITFINKKTNESDNQEEFKFDYSGFKLNFDLEVTPDAEAQLIFDSKIGDVIRGKGEGNLKMGFDGNNNFKMYGEYIIDDGDYLFTLQNVINKRFKIQQGGSILWNGEPYDADIDIEAIYNLKTNLSSLVDSSYYNFSNTDYKKRIPVECQVFLTNKLMNPNIRFNIELPTADEESKTLVRAIINTEEKLNKQFLSLLVLNSFMREQSGTDNTISTGSTAGSVTTSELLSNQLSNWLSQISDEWDIGVNYRPGDEISKDQVEVALSTQLLNDRVSVNGNVGYGGQNIEQTSNIVGDFNVDVKLNKSGKLRVKAFNESNDKLIYENAPYTQGVGVFYREEFNSFSDLFHKFWNKIKGEKKDTTNH